MSASVFLHPECVCGFSEKFFKRIFETVLSNDVFEFLKEKRVTVSVASVSSEEIRSLNRCYRKKDTPTDVLSFGNYASLDDVRREQGNVIDIGEVVLCCDIIKVASREDEVSLERELVFIVAHGFLHLLGFNHSPEMFLMQDETCDRLTGHTSVV